MAATVIQGWTIEEWFTSGRVLDLILALVAVEAALLVGWRLVTGGGIGPAGLLANLAAGALLILAVRAAVTGAGWPFVALFLGLSLVAHLADLALRWQGPPDVASVPHPVDRAGTERARS